MRVFNINWCFGEKGRSCFWIAEGTIHPWTLASGRLSLSSLWWLTLPEWNWKPSVRIREIHPRGFQKWQLEQTQKWENTLSHLRGVLNRGLRPVSLTCCDYGGGVLWWNISPFPKRTLVEPTPLVTPQGVTLFPLASVLAWERVIG